MIQAQLKLRLTHHQESECERYLYHLASVWNWGLRKIELNAANKIYFSKTRFQNLLAGHSERMEIPSHVMQAVLRDVHEAWSRCFKGISRKPRLKGISNRMNSIPFPDRMRARKGNRLHVLGLGDLRFHKMDIPEGAVKCSRIVKRASGWYLCLFIEAEPKPIERLADGVIGIDPGFSALLTTSDGEIIAHPREQEAGARRFAQAQRGHRKQLAARLQERIANRKKDRNHKLSRHLVATNEIIVFSADNHSAVARRFGKSVASSAHRQLRGFLAYKSPKSGTQYLEVDCRNSTKSCSTCGALSGPSGLSGLAVRQWTCACGSHHDRDVNAAVNTLIAGVGLTLGTEISRLRESHHDGLPPRESHGKET